MRALAIEPLAYDELAGQVAERFAASVDEARRLLDKLIDAGLLLSELRVSPVDDPIAQFISRAKRIEPDLATELQQALEASHAFDRQPLDERSEASYCALVDAFRALLGERVENALQVDMRVPFLGTIGRGWSVRCLTRACRSW